MSDLEDFESPFTLTLKAGTGYDAPWLVLRGKTAGEVAALLVDAQSTDLLDLASAYSKAFQAKFRAAPSSAATGTPSQSQSTQAPAATEPADGAVRSLEEQINAAGSAKELGVIFNANKSQWNSKHKELAEARVAALKKESK